MAEITLTFNENLDCSKCDGVILTLHNPNLHKNNNQTLPGTIRDLIITGDSNNRCQYTYTIEYDENTYLKTPATLLQECDIKKVCCATCMIEYIDDALSGAQNLIVDQNNVTQEVNEATDVFTVTLPLIDTANDNAAAGNITLDLSVIYDIVGGPEQNSRLDAANAVVTPNVGAESIAIAFPVVDKINGDAVLGTETVTLDLSTILAAYTPGSSFDCTDLAANLGIRDNTVDSAIKELVTCAGTPDENVVGAIDTRGFVNNFQTVGTQVQARTVNNNLINVLNIANMVDTIEFNGSNPRLLEFKDRVGTVVFSLDLSTVFQTEDLSGEITIRNNTANNAIKEFVIGAGTGGEEVIGDIDLSGVIDTITETVDDCGTRVEFRDTLNNLIYTLVNNNTRVIAHAGHALGSPGDLVAVKPAVTPGQYAVAGYTGASDTASHLAKIIDADSYELLGEGFYVFPGHGYTIGGLYSGSSSGFVLASTLYPDDIVQNAFIPQSINCIYVNLEQAQVIPDSCKYQIINATGDATMLAALAAVGANGTLIVTPDGAATSGYKPAVAEDEIIFVATPIDTDGVASDEFVLHQTGAILDSVAPAGATMVAVPTSQVPGTAPAGTIVNKTSLVSGDMQVLVGRTTASGCLHINVGIGYTLP